MCDKSSFRDCPSGIAPPKSAEEIYAEKQRKSDDITMYFTNTTCPLCKMPVYTNGFKIWCKRECYNDGKSTRGYMQFLRENVR